MTNSLPHVGTRELVEFIKARPEYRHTFADLSMHFLGEVRGHRDQEAWNVYEHSQKARKWFVKFYHGHWERTKMPNLQDGRRVRGASIQLEYRFVPASTESRGRRT